MTTDIPYMPSVSNLSKILDAIQRAGAPEAFGLDFLKDLGFTSSNDRAVIKLLKFLGMLDTTGKPQSSYREFMDGSRAKSVLGTRIRSAFDDLFLADKQAQNQSAARLKGWFKTKTGASDAVAEKIASTFKALASYSTFDDLLSATETPQKPEASSEVELESKPAGREPQIPAASTNGWNFAYRIEVHLPDTTSVDTYRAIFKALREELG